MKKYILLLALVPIFLVSCEDNNRSVLRNSNTNDIAGVYFAQVTDTFECYIENQKCYLIINNSTCTDSVETDFQDFECFGDATHLCPVEKSMYYSIINNTMYLYNDSLKTIPIICNCHQLSISILGCQLEYKGIVYSKQ